MEYYNNGWYLKRPFFPLSHNALDERRMVTKNIQYNKGQVKQQENENERKIKQKQK